MPREDGREAVGPCKEQSMNDFIQFALAMWDAFRAAMIGLNAIPAIVISLLIGMGQAHHGGYALKAIVAVVPAMLISALWPMAYSATPIWPDLRQLEVEMQIAVLLLLSYIIIRLVDLIKQTLSGAGHHPRKA